MAAPTDFESTTAPRAPRVGAASAVAALWRDTELAEPALERLTLDGSDPVLPSSFAVGCAAQATLAAAALAATEIGALRNGVEQRVAIDMHHAALECCGRFTLDGRAPVLWDPIAGLYRCEGAGWVRLHTNFTHHRDGVLRLLGLPVGAGTPRAAVADALQRWSAHAFEATASDAGLVVVAALRSFEEWDAHPQSAAVASLPLVSIRRLGDAAPLDWPALPQTHRPLAGLRVLDLTRILAGPIAGRTLAGYGADVLLVNGPHLPNIEAIADTSRGKRSALADLRTTEGRAGLHRVLRAAHVLIQGYRPGALAAFGLAADDVAKARPGIVMVSLSAYGSTGPWAGRRGFDSLVQTATGFNHAEAQAKGAAEPKPLPMQILDLASGYLMAFGAEAALLRQRREGGSWHVEVSLARTARWLRDLGRVDGGFGAPPPVFDALMQCWPSGYGELRAVRHAAVFSRTTAFWALPSMPPGSHPVAWSSG